jgi:hypothetical protein
VKYFQLIVGALGIGAAGAAVIFPRYQPILLPLGTFFAGWATPNQRRNGSGTSVPPPPKP